MNLFPVAAAIAVLVLVVWGFSGLMRMAQPKIEEDVNPMPMIGRQPEFFSTIRPEQMNTAEVDVVDDPTKASEYFANSLFIGDTWMARLMDQRVNEAQVKEYLEKALFLTNDSYSWDALRGEFNNGALTLNLYGEYVSLLGAVQKTGAQKVFIQLGRMDLLMQETDTAVSFAEQALSALRGANPDTQIIVFTMTPNSEESNASPINKKIARYNAGLREVCAKDKGIRLIDAAALFPEEGLTAEYCADPEGAGTKLNAAGYLLVVNDLVDEITTPQMTMPTQSQPTPTAAPTVAPPEPENTSVPQPAPGGNAPAAGRTQVTN